MQNEVVWRPNFDGFSGIPAGLQCDKSNSLWVADMALGLLQFNLEDGTSKQVTYISSLQDGIATYSKFRNTPVE